MIITQTQIEAAAPYIQMMFVSGKKIVTVYGKRDKLTTRYSMINAIIENTPQENKIEYFEWLLGCGTDEINEIFQAL